MNVRRVFVPATIAAVRTIDPGEIRAVTLVLPEAFEIEATPYPIQDDMRPGNAFLARPLGARTLTIRPRLYTRSNCARTDARVLEVIINHTHEAEADTSIWWQTEQVDGLRRARGTIDMRADLGPESTHLVLYESSKECKPTNLRLEPDDVWADMRILAIALSTGITPFLAYLRHMRALAFGATPQRPGGHVTLIASVRHAGQLMEHAELLALEREFPAHFRYHPVLTRAWPSDWSHGKGRILRVTAVGKVDLQPLLEVVPDLEDYHVRFCGNAVAREQLSRGLRQGGQQVRSLRAEVW